jgi:hypothetical protein
MSAQIPAPQARPHPSRRSGIAEFGAGIVAGRTKVRSAPVVAAAKQPLSTPEKRVAKPTTAIAPVASHGSREQRVPSVMKAAPTDASPRYATRRVRGGPPNSTSTRIANDPKAAKIDVCGCAMTLSANAKTAGMTIAARAALFSAARSGTVAMIRPRLPPGRGCKVRPSGAGVEPTEPWVARAHWFEDRRRKGSEQVKLG